MMISVSPPATICPSAASSATVPERAAAGATTSKLGVATTAPAPLTAVAGTVTVMVSAAVMS